MFPVLGGSLRAVLMRLKAQPSIYPSIEVAYSFWKALQAPVTVSLPANGLRLRFDGPDQRLRLIEVLDFGKTILTYKGSELVKPPEASLTETTRLAAFEPNGPAFRNLYQKLFGPTHKGEYFPPSADAERPYGTYVLSYPGIAFSFVLPHSAWPKNETDDADFVKLLSSPAVSVAKCMTIFNGKTWSDARRSLYSRPCPHPRSLAIVDKARDPALDEIDLVTVLGRGAVQIRRRSGHTFQVQLGESTPQDLVAWFGPPDAIYRKNDRRLSIHKNRTLSRGNHPPPVLSGSPGQVGGFSDTDRSSLSAATDGSSPDEEPPLTVGGGGGLSTESFWNYHRHGFDVFVSYAPSPASPELNPATVDARDSPPPAASTGTLVATKLVLHGNVPGAHAFNQYRRSRWTLESTLMGRLAQDEPQIDSETPFSETKRRLDALWTRSASERPDLALSHVLQKHMVLNRGWGDSPGSSCELLGEWEDAAGEDESPRKSGSGQLGRSAENAVLGNTELHGYPGLLFEVLKNDTVECLTVY